MSDSNLLLRIKELEERVANIELIEYSKVYWETLSDTTSSETWSTYTSKGTADDQLIDLSDTFGLPANVTAIIIRADVYDTDTGNPVGLVSMGHTDPPSSALLYADYNGGQEIHNTVFIKCDANGDVYISFSETIDNFRFFILGWVV